MKKILLKNILSILVLVLIIISIVILISLNILPNKYLLLIIGVNLALFIIGLLLYNNKSKILFIIGIIIYIITILSNGCIYYYLGKANKYIDNNFSKKTYQVETEYYLITSILNEVNSIDEIADNTVIEYYKYSRAINLALKKLNKYSLNSTDNTVETLIRMKNTKEYLLMSSNDYNFLFDSSNAITKDEFKIIHTFTVTETKTVTNKTKDIYSIYINGLDYSGFRRDYNMIATINTKTHKIVLTSIPRDYYIYVPAYDLKDSLTALGSVDSEITKEALEKLFDIKIDYIINLYTESLVKIVDTIGGVEFCSEKSYYTTHDLTLGSYADKGKKLYVKKGCYEYNGLEALAIARERLHYEGGDRNRIENCRQLFINISKKLLSTTTITNYNEVLKSLDGIYTTNINKRTVTNLIKSFLDNPNYEIKEQSVDGIDGKGIGKLGTGEVWTLEPIQETVDAASKTIKEVIGEK